MNDILFLCQRIPYPPDKGDKIRSYRVLEHLQTKGRVHLGFLIDDKADWQHVAHLEKSCGSLFAGSLNPLWARVRSTSALLSGQPLSRPYFYNRRLQQYVDQVLETHRPETVVIFSSVMAQYVARHPLRPKRLLIDYVDVDSDKWRQYAQSKSGLARLIYAREASTLLKFDREVGSQADLCSFVSLQEAALFKDLAPELAEKSQAISNGIDTEYFASAGSEGAPLPEFGAGPNLVMTGHMDYWPNIDAAEWFADEIFPLIRDRHAGATFHIVGASPPQSLSRRSGHGGIHVTGRVPDVRPYLEQCDLVVAPMRIARGIQNKVLEGMAMGKKVVTTPQGFEGIDAVPGRHLRVAEGAQNFAAEVHEALNSVDDPMGSAARAHVKDTYQWPARMKDFDPFLAD
jgi:sugar transferase (PEP-CTERM/EpsH1 system associated)